MKLERIDEIDLQGLSLIAQRKVRSNYSSSTTLVYRFDLIQTLKANLNIVVCLVKCDCRR